MAPRRSPTTRPRFLVSKEAEKMKHMQKHFFLNLFFLFGNVQNPPKSQQGLHLSLACFIHLDCQEIAQQG